MTCWYEGRGVVQLKDTPRVRKLLEWLQQKHERLLPSDRQKAIELLQG